MELFLDRYEVGTQIAKGELCDVYLARRQEDHLDVVIKLVREVETNLIHRVVREQELLQEIDHPNVVKVLETGYLDDRPYLILKHVNGSSLRDLIREKSPLSVQLTQKIIRQIADGLAALHARNIVHRDIKPENILVDANGNAILIDFSIGSKIQEQGFLTGHNESVGTAEYMSPEQRLGLGVDARSDQFSLAAVAFEMLTGHFAIGQFRSPSQINPDLDPFVDHVLIRAMENNPDDRFPDIKGFSNALNEVMPERPESSIRSQRPRTLVALLLVLLALIPILYSQPWNFTDKESSTNTTSLKSSASPHDLETTTNSIGMKFVLLPAGEFEYGTALEQIEFYFDGPPPEQFRSEAPIKKAIIKKPFWMGVSEVSTKQFREFIEETGYETTSEGMARLNGRKPLQPLWNDPVHFDANDSLPVIAVSWTDANEFCKWLSEKEGKLYRLPSEIEWEYACRANTAGPWSCRESELDKYAVLDRDWETGPNGVAKLRPNPWGLHDMHGNVLEWCQDEYIPVKDENVIRHTSFYRASSLRMHVVRGGTYKATPVFVRCAARQGCTELKPTTDRGHGIGFRVVMESSP